ncbi:MAG: IgGFc-binding protein, partial [Prevotellaceae bacterium]|nr:IgGFc-binding protein [Prevotellaceae bacterium]
MKTILKIISIIILAFPFGEKLYSQATSTQGTDFWLSFGRNRNNSYTDVNLQVRVVTSDAATVTFTYTTSGIVNTVSIAAGSVYTYAFSNQERNRVYSFNAGKTNKSLHIESDVPISVYALNQQNVTADATNILPLTGLGTDYYHISYKCNNSSYNEGYTVIATEDNTEIYEDGTLKDTLQTGEVYSAYFGAEDVTGKHITSNHPIAYFVTSGGVWIPINTGNGSDCLYQQLVPVNKWGNNFLVPVTHRGVERIRIVASQDSTVITQSGGTIVTDNGGYSQNSLNLDRGQFVELVTTLDNCGCYISSNKPVGVCTYLIGYYNSTPPYLLVDAGDPAIAWVPPIEQAINGALIAPFIPGGNSALHSHYALVVTPTATKGQTTMAIGINPSTSLTGGQWCDNAISNFSFYSLPLYNTTDAYYFANPNGLTVMGYGIGDAESYYYLSGSASRDLDAAFYVNNVHYQDLDEDIICDTAVNFRASIQYAMSSTPGYLKWFIDSVEQVSVRDTLEWSGTLPIGIHNVYIEVLDMENDTITLSSTFGVDIPYYDTIDTMICLGKRYFDDNFDTIPTQAGFISLTHDYTTTIGCDSIFTLNLTVNPSYHDTINVEMCAGGCYQENGFNICSEGAIEIFQDKGYKTSNNCDSIITLHLTVHPTYDDTIKAAICLGERYNHYNFDTIPTQAGTVICTHYDTTVNGCDSLMTLNLIVRPSYNDTLIREICLGESYEDTDFNLTPTDTGTVYDSRNLKTALNCDSIITLQLTVHPVYDTTIYATICLGGSYEDDNFDTIPTQAGIVIDSVNTPTVIGGCDSIIRLHLTVNQTYNDTIIDTICLGEVYDQYNFNETPLQSGNFTFIDDDTTINGCDSLMILNLFVKPSYHDTLQIEICLGESYGDENFIDLTPTDTGTLYYTKNFTTLLNCDSIKILQLTVHPVYDDTINAAICLGESYNDYNFEITPTQTGYYTFVNNETSVNGCDSITTLLLTVNPVYYDTIIDTICLGEVYNQYNFNETPLQSGNFTFVNDETTAQGCDSITTLLLTVNHSYHDTIKAAICQNEYYSDYGFYIAAAQRGIFTYVHDLTTSKNCDSVTTLQLTVNPVYDEYRHERIYE